MIRLRLIVVALLTIGVVPTTGAPLRNYPQRLVQPDGTVIHCLASGDEFHHWLHDKDGYTIVQHPLTGFYVYALPGGLELAPSEFIVGSADPGSMGLTRDVHPSLIEAQQRRMSFAAKVAKVRDRVANTGTMNNITIFLRFADESQTIFPDSIALYDRMFNASSAGASSLYNYYKEVSYSQLGISTTFYPTAAVSVLSYQDTHARNYYRPYNVATNPIGYANNYEARNREQVMVKNAITAIASQVPSELNVDDNNDGNVDNICFIVSGDADGWAYQLWPHMEVLDQFASINGKSVLGYDFQLRDFLMRPDRGVCTLCHEMFHSLGAPDLYNYTNHLGSNELFPVWIWDVMGCKNQPYPMVNPPQHMCAYMKWKYGGWISTIPVISTPGTYTLSPLTASTNNCYRIPSPFSVGEYFVVEYRRRSGTFESSLPGEGLVVYRINTNISGNAGGPPDEVYIYRPWGTRFLNGSPDSAALSANAGRTLLNDSTNPGSFLADGSPGGLNISNVGLMGSTISFTVSPVNKAIFSIDTRAITLGGIDINLSHRDTTFLLINAGGQPDSVYLQLNYKNIPIDSAASISTTAVGLAGLESKPVTFRVRPRFLSPDTNYNAVVIADSRFGFGRTHYERTITFEVIRTSVSDAPGIPRTYALAQNFPNPFNPCTTIKYELPRSSVVKLSVYDILGREVSVLVNERREAGVHNVTFDASNLASGVYFYRLQAGDYVASKRMLVLK